MVDYSAAHWTLCLSRDQPWVLRIAVSAHRGSGSEERIAVRPRTETVGRPDVVVQSLPERLARGCLRSLTDLDALSIPDERNDARRLLAAGIPWFVALFGRDALISSYQARAFRPELILDTLAALAARQGRVDDPGNEEQPGTILHEVRFGDRPWLGEGTAGGTRPITAVPYAYRARRELAAVLSHLGHHAEADDLIAEAKELRELIRRRYWQPGADGRPGSFALALDQDKRQVDSITSNMAHLLWCGVPSPQEAEQVASQPGHVQRAGASYVLRRDGGLQPDLVSRGLGMAARHPHRLRGPATLRARRCVDVPGR
jgi:glycogen debranching enzyme